MKLKSISKRTVALALAMCCFSWNITAYAADDSFKPIFSGRLSYTVRCYIDSSDDDCALTKVWYKQRGTSTSYFVTVNRPAQFYFTSNDFAVQYDHPAEITDLFGEFKGYTQYGVIFEADKVITERGLFNIIKNITVEYNGYSYKK